MGIVNVTPDSFYKSSRAESENAILYLVEKHLNNDADFIDLGGYSSRPGAENISQNTELDRLHRTGTGKVAIPVKLEMSENKFKDFKMHFP